MLVCRYVWVDGMNRCDMEKDVDGERRMRGFKPHYIEQPQAASTYVHSVTAPSPTK